jgi:hypothetical protein
VNLSKLGFSRAGAAALLLAVAAAPAAAEIPTPANGAGPSLGVYGCMDQNARELATLQWGILDGSTYSTFDGGRGRYVYNTATQILTFTSGPFQGLKRGHYGARSFIVLDENGHETAFTCPWEGKDPRKLHW